MSQDRTEYMRMYHKKNIDRIKERNRINYLKRKEAMKSKSNGNKKHEVLIWLENIKKERLANMTTRRLAKRKKLQNEIYREIKMKCD